MLIAAMDRKGIKDYATIAPSSLTWIAAANSYSYPRNAPSSSISIAAMGIKGLARLVLVVAVPPNAPPWERSVILDALVEEFANHCRDRTAALLGGPLQFGPLLGGHADLDPLGRGGLVERRTARAHRGSRYTRGGSKRGDLSAEVLSADELAVLVVLNPPRLITAADRLDLAARVMRSEEEVFEFFLR